MDDCKVCGKDVEGIAHSIVSPEGDELYVIKIDDKLYLLKEDDTLCQGCNGKAVYYKRMDL